jgi:hypothetical protein
MATVAAALGVWMSAAAQPASAPGPSASAAKPGAATRGPAARWGAGYTPGWTMMTPQERDEHRKQMQGATTRDECKALMDKHHQQMVERAKQQGKAVPGQPRRDACSAFKAT